MKHRIIKMLCLMLVMILLASYTAPLADASMYPETLCEVERGEIVTIQNHSSSVVNSTNLTFRGNGSYGFVARISVYDMTDTLIEEKTIFSRKESWMELYFYGKTMVIEVLLGNLTVTYNMDRPEYEIAQNGERITWTVETSFENIYLTTGDTAQYGFHDVYPGVNVWLEEDYFDKNADGESTAFESSNRRVATVDPNGVITAVSPGTATIKVAYRFGLSDSNSILYTQKCTVTVLDAPGIGDAYGDYYLSGSEKYYHISGVGASQPLSDITLRHRGAEENTGESNSLIMDTYPDSGYGVTFSAPGYHSYELQPKYISDYNFITLCPDDGSTAPIIKAVMGCDLSNNVWQNLRMQALSVREGRNYCVDVDIDWQDHEPLAVWLQQGDTKVTFGTFTSTGFIQLGKKLSIGGGPVYLYAQALDGTIVKTQLLLNIYAPLEVFELDMGDESGLTATTEDVDGFNDIGFELKLGGNLPITYKVDADGKVKGVVGVTLLGGELKDSVYNTVKDGLSQNPNTPGGGVDVSQMVDTLMMEESIEPQWIKKSVAISCDVLVLGCFEGYVANGKTHFTDMSLAVCVKGEVTYTQQSIAFYAPYYWTVGLRASIESQLVAIKENQDGELKFTFPETTLTVRASGSLSLGIQGLAGVGAELAGTITMTFKTGETIDKGLWTVQVSFMPLVQAFGFTLRLEVWEPKTLYIYDGTGSSIYQEQGYCIVGRSYHSPTKFVGETVVSEDLSITTETLFTDLYPSSMPQIVSNGDKTLLVWIDDNAARTNENRTCLYYCVYDEATGVWSEPKAVCDDGLADHTPKLYSVGGKTHLVWLKASCIFPSGVTLSETAAMLDVCYAEFDFHSETFSEPVHLSASEGVYDFSPCVTQINGQLTVIWGSNHSGDIFSAENCYSLSAARLTEAGWQAETVMADLPPINGLTVREQDGALCICFCGHTDGQLGTLDDMELFTVYNGVLSQVTDNDYPDSAPEYHGGELYYCSNTGLTTGQVNIAFPTTKTSYTIITNEAQTVTAVLYTVLTKESHNIYATVNNGNGWGEPVRVTDLSGQYIADFSACFAGDQLITVASLHEINADGTLGAASMVKSSKPMFADLAVTDAYYDPLTLVEGGILQGSVVLVNHGMQTVDAGLVSIYSEDGTCISTVQIKNVPILPGETKIVPFICEVDHITSKEIRAEVTAIGTTEPNRANNSLSIAVNKHDISVANVYITGQEAGFSTVTVFLENRGMETIYDALLVFHKNSPNGEALSQLLVAVLQPGEKKMLSVQIPTDAIDQIVYVTAQMEQPENLYANNTNFVYLGSIQTTVAPDAVYCTGDINGDGVVSEEDVLVLRQYLVGGYDAQVNPAACDVNSDGAVNAKDVATLRRMLSKTQE